MTAEVQVVAGQVEATTTPTMVDGVGWDARFSYPNDICAVSDTELLVTDMNLGIGTGRLRKITFSDPDDEFGTVSTVTADLPGPAFIDHRDGLVALTCMGDPRAGASRYAWGPGTGIYLGTPDGVAFEVLARYPRHLVPGGHDYVLPGMVPWSEDVHDMPNNLCCDPTGIAITDIAIAVMEHGFFTDPGHADDSAGGSGLIVRTLAGAELAGIVWRPLDWEVIEHLKHSNGWVSGRHHKIVFFSRLVAVANSRYTDGGTSEDHPIPSADWNRWSVPILARPTAVTRNPAGDRVYYTRSAGLTGGHPMPVGGVFPENWFTGSTGKSNLTTVVSATSSTTLAPMLNGARGICVTPNGYIYVTTAPMSIASTGGTNSHTVASVISVTGSTRIGHAVYRIKPTTHIRPAPLELILDPVVVGTAPAPPLVAKVTPRRSRYHPTFP